MRALVAPISSATLRDVYDVLCGHKEDDWWKKSFYEIDGLYKLMLCNRILTNPDDNEARKELMDANKADILALRQVMEKLEKLNSTVAHQTLSEIEVDDRYFFESLTSEANGLNHIPRTSLLPE